MHQGYGDVRRVKRGWKAMEKYGGEMMRRYRP